MQFDRGKQCLDQKEGNGNLDMVKFCAIQSSFVFNIRNVSSFCSSVLVEAEADKALVEG